MTPAAVKIELSGDDIEIEFADGTKQEIEAGRFERKNAEGDTVEERAATAADRGRLEAIVAGADPARVTQEAVLADGTVIEIGQARIEATFSDGTRQEIETGRFEQKAADGTTLIERPATQGDIDGLVALVPAGLTPPDLAPGAPGNGDDDDGTPDQGSGDAPGTPGDDDDPTPGDDDGTPDQGSGNDDDRPGVDDDRRIAEDVTLFFTELLGRAPAREGLNHWIDRAEAGFDLDDLAGAFTDSIEFETKFGDTEALANRGFVETLFDEVLARDGAETGLAFWTEKLDDGMTRDSLVVAFTISDENRDTTPELDALVEIAPGEWDLAG